ncbi:HAD-IIA family hydrolase [Paenibacillus sp. Marseille-P2973]|uniref:HAD-IIA family hydrolase n=1 Tax=Paenibacillus sp. Marseille-P2973 TaxID=1871032 RepID=UPI001B368FD4|nr:HAD-IIA family hydrolase [Paenibacillus sp. Marseille-P2973]MBQ4899287.1 HAD-IIA family hydrolase [Paenibacillus sp. Marseille-P2973]
MQQIPLSDFSSYLFDLDGTIYVGNRVLEGAASTIEGLRERMKTVLFATNTTVYTREEVRDKLGRFGIACTAEEVITALSVAGMYFRNYASGAKVLLLGDEAMREEMTRSGIAVTGEASHATHVLVGLDRTLDFDKLTAAVNAVRNGAFLIAANPDPYCPMEDGVIPDTWALVKAIETAGNRLAHDTVGKPSGHYAAYALQKLKSPPEQCLMVGDKLETDIMLGKSIGMRTALVLSGVDSRESVRSTGIHPDYICSSINDILEETRLETI